MFISRGQGNSPDQVTQGDTMNTKGRMAQIEAEASRVPAGADPSEWAVWYRKGYRASSRPNRKDLGHYDDLYAGATQHQKTAFLDGWDDAANGEEPAFVTGKWGTVGTHRR
jgi:hypothetical protein